MYSAHWQTKLELNGACNRLPFFQTGVLKGLIKVKSITRWHWGLKVLVAFFRCRLILSLIWRSVSIDRNQMQYNSPSTSPDSTFHRLIRHFLLLTISHSECQPSTSKIYRLERVLFLERNCTFYKSGIGWPIRLFPNPSVLFTPKQRLRFFLPKYNFK